MLMLDPIMALAAPSASPCTLLGVAGGVSSTGTAGPLPPSPHPCGTLCQGETCLSRAPQEPQCHSLRMPCLQWAPTHLFQTMELASSVTFLLSERCVRAGQRTCFQIAEGSCAAPLRAAWALGVLLGLTLPTGLDCACCTQAC